MGAEQARKARLAVAEAHRRESIDEFDWTVDESKKINYVRTAEGARKYGQPVGSPIRPDGPKIDYTRRGPKRAAAAPARPAAPVRPASPVNTPIPGGRVGVPSERREQAFAPDTDPMKVPVAQLTGSSIETQMRQIAAKKNRSKADEDRFGELDDERERRDKADSPRVAPTPDRTVTVVNGDTDVTKLPVNRMADNLIDFQARKLAEKKARTKAEDARLAELTAERKRRDGLASGGSAGAAAAADQATARTVTSNAATSISLSEPFARMSDAGLKRQLSEIQATPKRSGRENARAIEVQNEIARRKQVRTRQARAFSGKVLAWDFDLEEKVRHVRTPEGVDKYGKPIGSPITAADRLRSVGRTLSDPTGKKRKASELEDRQRRDAEREESSSAREMDAARAQAARRPKVVPTPLTDEEYEKHTQEIERVIGEAVKAGKSTDSTFSTDGGRTWDPERAKQHKELLDELYGDARLVPNDGKAMVAGGLGGAGKSTVLASMIDPDKYLTLNPDDIKERMADKGMIPQIEGLSPMEASALIHEESSYLANTLAKRAYAEKKNIVWDITMASRGSVEKRITAMREAGYTDLSATFVDIPVETSVQRALGRHRSGMERYRNGIGDGGRYVPPKFIRANEHAEWSSANRATYESLKPSFDKWNTFDNSGSAPVQVADSESAEVKWLADVRAKALARDARLTAGASGGKLTVEVQA